MTMMALGKKVLSVTLAQLKRAKQRLKVEVNLSFVNNNSWYSFGSYIKQLYW